MFQPLKNLPDKNDLYSAFFKDSDQNGDYRYLASSNSGSIHNAKGGTAHTALFDMENINDTEKFGSYCVDITTYLDTAKLYHEASETEIKQLFQPNIVNIIRKIANCSYPVIDNAEYLCDWAKTKGLSIPDIVSATQAAIWTYTNSDHFAIDKTNPENLKKFAFKLIYDCNDGWDMTDVEKRAREIKVELDDCRAEVKCRDGKIIRGPYKLKSDSCFLKNKELAIKLPEGCKNISIVNKYFRDLEEIKIGEDFFIVVPKDSDICCVKIDFCIELVYGADVCIIVVDKCRESQALCLIKLCRKKFCFTIEFDLRCKQPVKIVKYDKNEPDKRLEGAEFKLFSGKQFIDYLKTDCDGIAYSKPLYEGCYTLIETCEPDGYYKDTDPIRFCIGKSCGKKDGRADDCKDGGKSDIVKDEMSENFGEMSQAFEETTEAFEEEILDPVDIAEENVTGENDEIAQIISSPEPMDSFEGETDCGKRDGKPDGKHKFRCCGEPCRCDDDCDDSICCEGPKVIYICNKRKPPAGCIKIIKFDICCESKRLSGAKFSVVGDCVNTVVTTDDCGEAEICNLEPGIYTVTEIRAPYGYIPNEKPLYVKVRCGQVEYLSIENQQKPEILYGTIKIKKHDAYCEETLLGGAVFDIFDSHDEKVDTVTTKQGEIAYSKKLPLGIYRLFEKCAPEGYKPIFEPVYVHLSATSTFASVSIPNRKISKPKTGAFKIIIRSKICKEGISGYEFTVQNEEGECVDKIETDHNGVAQSCPLPYGNYKVINTKTPDHCEKFEIPLLITIDSGDYIPVTELQV